MHRSNVMAEVADEFRGETRQREDSDACVNSPSSANLHALIALN